MLANLYMSNGHPGIVRSEIERSAEEKELSEFAEPHSGAILLATDKVVKQESCVRSTVCLDEISSIRIMLNVMIPVAYFRLHILQSLRPGSIVPTAWLHSEDIPVSAGDVRLAWSEFAITGRGRSVRVTRIP